MSSIFEHRMEKRRRWGLIIGLAGAIFSAALTYVLMVFALIVAVPLSDSQRSIVTAIVCVTVTVAYLSGWAARGFHSENIDTQIGDMGPIRKQILIDAINEQIERDKVEPPLLLRATRGTK